MGALSFDVKGIERGLRRKVEFPHAPLDWTRDKAEQLAAEEELKLTDEHWQAVRALQEFFARHEEEPRPINMRELHDALDELFHPQGGIRHLYMLFPGGPIAQGCRVAGLTAPFIATDTSFGSVA
jgi:tRNA 2-thiouridine synthesizing protein E